MAAISEPPFRPPRHRLSPHDQMALACRRSALLRCSGNCSLLWNPSRSPRRALRPQGPPSSSAPSDVRRLGILYPAGWLRNPLWACQAFLTESGCHLTESRGSPDTVARGNAGPARRAMPLSAPPPWHRQLQTAVPPVGRPRSASLHHSLPVPAPPILPAYFFPCLFAPSVRLIHLSAVVGGSRPRSILTLLCFQLHPLQLSPSR